MSEAFMSPAWYNAVTLTERAHLHGRATAPGPRGEVDAELGSKRLRRWQSQYPFATTSLFAQRLESEGLSEEEMEYLLGEPAERLSKRLCGPPEWLSDLARAFSRSGPTSPLPVPEQLRGTGVAGLLDALEPLISQARERLGEGAAELAGRWSPLPFDPATVEALLFQNLPEPLFSRFSRTAVLELNVARLEGKLGGDTPEERFWSFVERLRQRDGVIALLEEYPVLARQLVVHLNHWADFSLEFLRHLCHDWEELRRTFAPDADPGVLTSLHGGMGDSHRDGRSVLIATFSSGFRIVYKPRSMALDLHFQELLRWLNARSNHPPFRTLTILDRETYGWTEFVVAGSCATTEEIQRFYERQGAYLILLHALKATDFHFENLIAAGEQPVLLDLEALFHQRPNLPDSNDADELAFRRLFDSVLGVGLLPRRIWSNQESDGIDLSGLGGEAGQLTPTKVSTWERAGTDEMQLVRKRLPMFGGQNRPFLDSQQLDLLDYVAEIVKGFTNLYRVLLEHRDELWAADGPLMRFANDEVRVIIRPTQTYSMLLEESFHPDVLRNALDRDLLFDRLWVGADFVPHLAKVIPAERKDLLKGDIPMFTARPNSRDLWSSSGERISAIFEESSLELARRRFFEMNERDLLQQTWFIRASLATLSADRETSHLPTYTLRETPAKTEPADLVRLARSAGDRLGELAVRGDENATWIGITPTNENHWSLSPLSVDLYDGVPGNVLFLAYLGAVTKDEQYTTLARFGLATMRQQMERMKLQVTSIGGFNGWGGVIYTFAHLASLWKDWGLVAEAEKVVEALPPLIEKDRQLDLIGGAAGCITGLLSLYRCAPSPSVLQTAIRCGERLIGTAERMERGIGWKPFLGATPLAGFSHGAAGIAHALLELAAVTGQERFRDVALDAFEYERSLFSVDKANWPDLRDFESGNEGERVFLTGWCHGAPGIGLGRVHALKHVDDESVRAEIRVAVQTTMNIGFGGNHSLCHGDLGNLELLGMASEVLGDAQLCDQAARLKSMIVESIDRDGWLCGISLGVESPGLMTGLAGIGYQLLRLSAPHQVPAILVMAPPAVHAFGD
jgi:type 2 lantibiotic biosynthesis protein LanM